MSTKLTLSRLPLDGIRPILSLVDLESMVKLYATFDRSIQKLVASSGAFNSLTIKLTVALPRAPLRYFLSAVRNVSQLVFADGTKWSAMTLPLLSTLNPTTLSIGSGMMHPSVVNLLQDFVKTPDDTFLRETAQNFTCNVLPNFKRLTPRLTTLTLRDSPGAIAGNLELSQFVMANYGLLPAFLTVPDTLTSLTLDNITQNTVLGDLYNMPPTIRSLSLGFARKAVVVLPTLFMLFPQLESLTISGISRIALERDPTEAVLRGERVKLPSFSEKDFVIPKSLNSLSLLNLDHIPLVLLQSPALKASSISSMVIHLLATLKESCSNLDLQSCLPPSILSLNLSSMPIDTDNEHFATFASLPTSLTHLTVSRLTSDSPAFQLLHLLKSLRKIDFLLPIASVRQTTEPLAQEEPEKGQNSDEAETPKKLPYIVPIHMLSRTVESITMIDSGFPAFEAHHIASLPPYLKQLIVADFNLSLYPLLKERAPLCRLTFYKYIELLKVGNGKYLTEKFADALELPSKFNLSQFHAAIISHYRPQGVSFGIGAISPSGPPIATVNEFVAFGPNVLETKFMSTKLITKKDEKPLGERMEPPYYAESTPSFPIPVERWLKNLALNFPSLTKIVLNVTNIAPCAGTFWTLKNLKHVELYDTPIVFSFRDLPASITHLSGNTSLEVNEAIEGQVMPNFKVLDFPYGSFCGRSLRLCGLKDMDRFYATVFDIADRDIIPLLTSDVSEKTRRNMRLSIRYLVTGDLLVLEKDDASLKNVTWDLLREKTDMALRRALDAPYCPTLSQGASTTPQSSTESSLEASIDHQKIGDVLETLKGMTRATKGHPIIVPIIAESVVFRGLTGEWDLSLGPFSVGPDESPWRACINSHAKITRHADAPMKSLTRLSLAGVNLYSSFWNTLPNSLTDLRISILRSLSDFGSTFPSSLRVLVLQSASNVDRSEAAERLPFCLSALPSTIEHFSIQSPSVFVLHQHVEECAVPLALPNLKSVRIAFPTEVTALAFAKILPIDTLEKFYVQEIKKTVPHYGMAQPKGMASPLQVCQVVGAIGYEHAFDLSSTIANLCITPDISTIPIEGSEVDSTEKAISGLSITGSASSPATPSNLSPLAPSSHSPSAAPVRRKVIRAPRK